jgi:hypothetical protein
MVLDFRARERLTAGIVLKDGARWYSFTMRRRSLPVPFDTLLLSGFPPNALPPNRKTGTAQAGTGSEIRDAVMQADVTKVAAPHQVR